MTTWIIGDVQGCAEPLERLLSTAPIDAERDRFWFVGDLVNRGPQSADVLRRIRRLGKRATVVLGNHDLHLIGLALGVRRPRKRDTIQQVLDAPDGGELIAWLRKQPLLHAEGKWLMVHAGLHPTWTWRLAVELAREIEPLLQSPYAAKLLEDDIQAPDWSESLSGLDRWRSGVAVLTRTRMFKSNGLQSRYHGQLEHAPADTHAWFDAPGRRWTDRRVAFGHWAALGVMVRDDVVGTDGGCVWGRQLCAVRAEDGLVIRVKSEGLGDLP